MGNYFDEPARNGIPSSEEQPLIIGLDEKARRRQRCRRFFRFLVAAVALFFVGQGVFALYAYGVRHFMISKLNPIDITYSIPVRTLSVFPTRAARRLSTYLSSTGILLSFWIQVSPLAMSLLHTSRRTRMK